MEFLNWKEICYKNFVVIVKLIVDGNWIYFFENILLSMFFVYCDILKKNMSKSFCLLLDFVVVYVWERRSLMIGEV